LAGFGGGHPRSICIGIEAIGMRAEQSGHAPSSSLYE